MSKTLLHKILIVVISLAVLAAGLIVYYAVIVPKATVGDKVVTLEIVYADRTYSYENIRTSTTTLAELLEEQNTACELALETESSEFGKFITALKGVKADTKTNWYKVSINGTMTAYGISAQTFVTGDKVTIALVAFDDTAIEGLDLPWTMAEIIRTVGIIMLGIAIVAIITVVIIWIVTKKAK